MSSELNKGTNITAAVKILLQTYENFDLLFAEMDRAAEQSSFVSHTQRFMRWKSDVDYNGWLTTSFIKLFQLDGEPYQGKVKDLRDSDLYAVEIDLEDEYPQIWLSRHKFDYSTWNWMPSTSDHYLFSYPLVDDKGWFQVTEENGLWKSKPTEKASKKYWGIKGSVALSIPLLNVDSPETVRSEIFVRLRGLPEIE